MIRYLIVAVCCCVISTGALGQDKKQLSTLECLTTLPGLKALVYVGQQLNDQRTFPTDAKQYKLGVNLRITIGTDIARLEEVNNAVSRSQQQFISDLGPTDVKNTEAIVERARKLQDNWQKLTDAPCPVSPGMIDYTLLNIGDDSGQNPIPVSVIAAIHPVLTGLPQ